jgi:PAS domain S-box-containing protein
MADQDASAGALESESTEFGEAPEALFRGLLEFAPDAIVIVDGTGRIRLVNSQAEKMFGYDRGELVGEPIEILLPDRSRAGHAVRRVLYIAEPRTRPMGAGLDLAGRRRDGSEFPVEISLSPLETADGLLVTSVIRDISERRRTERELESRAEQQAIVVELGMRALLGTDLALVMVEIVDQVARQLAADYTAILTLSRDKASFHLEAGYGWPEGCFGKPVLDAGNSSHAGFVLLSDSPLNVLDLGTESRFQPAPLLAERGVVSVAAVPIYVQNQAYGVLEVEATRARTFTRDDMNFLQATANVLSAAIERSRGERLQRERDFLRAEKLSAVGQIAAGVAHELRNPLTSIKGLIQVNRKEAEARGSDVEDFRIIEREVRRMERTLQTFLDFARPPQPDRRRQELAPIVERTLALVRGRVEKQGVAIEVARPASPVVADVDADQIQQLLLNLALNSLDVMPHGGALHVEIRSASPSLVEIEVRDTGPGIQPTLLPRIFEPFVSGKEAGVGLGLAVSRRIAEDHGGWLTAGGACDGGARFTLGLPCRPAE